MVAWASLTVFICVHYFNLYLCTLLGFISLMNFLQEVIVEDGKMLNVNFLLDVDHRIFGFKPMFVIIFAGECIPCIKPLI